jgi:hypothetical protein
MCGLARTRQATHDDQPRARVGACHTRIIAYSECCLVLRCSIGAGIPSQLKH